MTNVTDATLAPESQACLNGSMETKTPKLCGCGCGEPVARRYRPGHDARHKSQLVTAAREATTCWTREQAVEAVFAHGWESHLDTHLLHDHPVRNHRRQTRIQACDVQRWIVGPDGTHHARTNCQHLTDSARKVGGIHPITRLARESVITRRDNTAEVLMEVTAEWDMCGQCAIDWSWDQVIEADQVRKEEVLSALDAEGTIRRNRKPTRKITLAEWTVTPDPLPSRNPFATPPIGLPNQTIPAPAILADAK